MSTAPRPYRDLCPDADGRDQLDEGAFWERAFGMNDAEYDDGFDSPDGPDLDVAIDSGVCDECGATGACSYDAEGRPLIHTTTEGRDT